VIGALGSISKGAKTWLGKLGVLNLLGSVHKSAIHETAQAVVQSAVSKLWGVAETQ